MERILEQNEIQLGLLQALNNTNATGKYFDMRQRRHVAAVLSVLAMAATKTAKIEFLQATSAAGGSAKAVSGAEKTVTANEEVIKATIALATVANTDVVTITVKDRDGDETEQAFVKAAATDTAAGEFADAAGLVSCIAALLTGVSSSVDTTTVTVVADDGYVFTVEKTEVAGTITLATVEAAAAVDVDVESLDTENGFYFVAPKVTTTANATAVSVIVMTAEQYFNKVGQAIPHTIL